MAGVIVARRNGRDGHGVAYNANLVSIATCKSSGGCTGDRAYISTVNEVAADIASAAGLTRTYGNIRSNPDAGSHVMNMSFTFTGHHDIPRITSAMRDAARANRIMVAALGNDAETGPAGAPASNMADSGIAGFGIAVGSLDRSGAGRADHSNTCGTVARYCLFAPGEDVVTTRNGGGLARVSGTSFAAPHVSGAAAVVWGAFPNKDANQIVDRLLTTARPLDGREISSTYGHGALDLAAALNPVGFLSLPMERSGAVPVRESFVDLPPGFGAPAAAALSSAVVYDQQAFPFLYDLNAAFRARGARSSTGAMRGFLSSLGGSTSVSIPGHGAVLEFTHEGGEFDPLRERAALIEDGGPWGFGRKPPHETRNYSLHLKLAPDVTASIGQGHGSPGASNSLVAARMGRGVLGERLSVGPFAAFAGYGPGLNLDWEFGEDISIDFAGRAGRGWFGDGHANLTSIGLTRRIDERWTVGTRYGVLRESGSLMGVRAEGAFGGISDAATSFVDLSVAGAVRDDLSLFGSVSQGHTKRARALISEWSGVRAESFAIGGEFSQLWRESDRLTVTVSSPFRVRDAMLYVNVPDREVGDGVVSYERRKVDLSPSGRERRLQLTYETGVEGGVSVAAGGYARFEPNHDASADTELGVAAKMSLRF